MEVQLFMKTLHSRKQSEILNGFFKFVFP